MFNCQLSFKRIGFSGDRTERVTPVPIPNTEVKPLRADGTARATLWETRSLPGLKNPEEPQGSSGFFALRASISSPVARSKEFPLQLGRAKIQNQPEGVIRC